MEYKLLTAEERLSMLRPRLVDAERRLYQLELDEVTQNVVGGMPAKDEAMRQVEWLRKEEARLEKEIKGNSTLKASSNG